MQYTIKDQANGHLVNSIFITTMNWHFLAKHHIPLVHLPPYIPDIDPKDFFLFPQIKNILKGKQFKEMETTKLNKTQQLAVISTRVWQVLLSCWNVSIQAEWTYIKRQESTNKVSLVLLISQHQCRYFLILWRSVPVLPNTRLRQWYQTFLRTGIWHLGMHKCNKVH